MKNREHNRVVRRKTGLALVQTMTLQQPWLPLEWVDQVPDTMDLNLESFVHFSVKSNLNLMFATAVEPKAGAVASGTMLQIYQL